MFKHWKDTSLPLPDEIKEITLKSLGEKQHNMLSLLRQYILLSELDNSRFIAVDGLAFDVETGLMWLRFAYGQTWQDGTAKGEAKVIRNGEQSPYKKRDAKVICDKDKEIEIDYFNGKFKRAEARRLSKKLEGYEGENYEFEICFEQGNYFLGEEMFPILGEKRERGYADFYDWRIPTVEESKTLVTNTNSDVFPDSSFVEGTDTCFRLVRGQ